MKKSTYIVLNGILPFLDVYSDYLTYEALLCSGDELFAMANLIVMFLPFSFKFALFSFDLVTKGRPSVEHLVGLVIHLPFVAPIVHVLLGIRLLPSTTPTLPSLLGLSRYRRLIYRSPQDVLVVFIFYFPQITRWLHWAVFTRAS